jgi:hypothetical protein
MGDETNTSQVETEETEETTVEDSEKTATETEKETESMDDRERKKEEARKFFEKRQKAKGKTQDSDDSDDSDDFETNNPDNIPYFEGRKIERSLNSFFDKYKGIATPDQIDDITELAFEAHGKVKPEAVAIQYLGADKLVEYGMSQKEALKETSGKKSLGGTQKQKTGGEGVERIQNLSAAEIAKNPSVLDF